MVEEVIDKDVLTAKTGLPTIQSTVTERLERFPIYFVHAIRPDSFPNSLLRDDATWQDALRVLLLFKPTLSASTVRWGNTRDNVISPMGVLLSNGNIESAHYTDNATVPVSLKVRNSRQQVDINRALINSGDVNEFVIRSPQIAGFFVWGDKPLLSETDRSKTMQSQIQKFVEEDLGIPVFIFDKGKLFAAEYDENKHIYVPHASVSAITLLDKHFSPSSELTQRLRVAVMSDSPFGREALPSNDAYYLLAQEYGRHYYLQLNSEKILVAAEAKMSAGDQKQIKVAEFPSGGRRKTFVYRVSQGNGNLPQLYRDEIDSSKHTFSSWIHHYVSRKIDLGVRSYELSANIYGVNDYLQEMSREIMRLKAQVEQQNDYTLHTLAYHLFGFSDQANEMNFLATRDKAREIASRVLSYDEYISVIKKRIGIGEDLN